jgi:hypothetical protein
MAYILTAQREVDVNDAFRRYRDYVATTQQTFPPGAFALASSDWYFYPLDHQCPHDAWLESLTVAEPSAGERNEQRFTTIHIRLLGAYHDGFIEFFYPRVFNYSLGTPASRRGHGDWRFDEFRVSPNGRLIHEIEWAGFPGGQGSRWVIEAADVEFRWIPK